MNNKKNEPAPELTWVQVARRLPKDGQVVIVRGRYSDVPTGAKRAAQPPPIAAALRKHLANIKDTETLAFVEEAVKCYEHGLLRSAVVMSWVGAVSLLYRHVVNAKLAEFNAEATRRNPKWKPAKTMDDLALMKEYDFLQVLQAISVIGKSVKTELEHCLDSRNGCGHPNTFKIADSKVAAHVEVLLLNVYEKF